MAVQTAPVNRSSKGDRLRPTSYPEAIKPARRMPEGCESSFSSIRKSTANDVPGRCIA
jgi:hypothetical protein